MQTKNYFNDDVVPFLSITIYIEKKFSFAENSIRIIKIFYQQCIYVLPKNMNISYSRFVGIIVWLNIGLIIFFLTNSNQPALIDKSVF